MTLEKLYRLVSIGIVFISNIIFGQSYINNLKFNPISENVSQRAITSIIKDQKGIIWIGTFFNGLHSFNPKTKVFKNYDSKVFADNDLVNVDIRTIYVDSENFIWVGTPYGLYKLEVLPNEAFKITSLKDSMTEEFKNPSNANYILSIYESSDKNIWIGTRGAGLCKYDKTNDKYTWFNKLNGLNEENISAIIESKKDNLWVSGNSGLTNINLEENIIKNYNYLDGLLSNDFNFNSRLKDKSGNIYFGNFKGIPTKGFKNKILSAGTFTQRSTNL